MRRIPTATCIDSSFRSSIDRALLVLYERRAEIEALIACLGSPISWTKNSVRFMETRSRTRKKSRKVSGHFREFPRTHGKISEIM